jgi:hypothetical protein
MYCLQKQWFSVSHPFLSISIKQLFVIGASCMTLQIFYVQLNSSVWWIIYNFYVPSKWHFRTEAAQMPTTEGFCLANARRHPLHIKTSNGHYHPHPHFLNCTAFHRKFFMFLKLHGFNNFPAMISTCLPMQLPFTPRQCFPFGIFSRGRTNWK